MERYQRHCDAQHDKSLADKKYAQKHAYYLKNPMTAVALLDGYVRFLQPKTDALSYNLV